MRMMSLSSGSTGNAVYVGSAHQNLLIDCGIPLKRVEQGLAGIGLSPADLDAVLITHEHIDHVGGLGTLLRKYSLPVYTTEGTASAVLAMKSLGRLPEENFSWITEDRPFTLGDLTVTAHAVPHDAVQPVIYRFDAAEASAAVVTDLGEAEEELVAFLQGLNGVFLEANHDIRMLQAGPYPYPLKVRIAGRQGHLSNEASGRLLSRILCEKLKTVVLSHISKTNNYPELAREGVRVELLLGEHPVPELLIAPEKENSPLIEL